MSSVCRVCLAGKVKLNQIESIPLLKVYERITCIQFNKDKRRSGFCSFCYQKLLKCYTFFAVAWRAENLFDQLLLLGVKEFETKLKLGVTQHMTVAPMQSMTIDRTTSYGPPRKAIKEEPIALIEEENVIIVKSEAVCRICLAGNLTLNPMESIPLQDIYQKLTNIKFNSEDSRPRAVCPFCYQKLLKCYIFSKTACRSEKLFTQLLLHGYKKITDELVTKLTLRLKQSFAVTHLQSITIDSKTSKPLQVTIKKEPIGEYVEENKTKKSGALILEKYKNKRLINQKPANFLCTICGKQYEAEITLKRHMYQLHRNSEEKYICKVCDKEFPYKNAWAMHMRCHSDIKKHTCNVCNKQFRNKHHLLAHLRIHTGEKPFPCTICQKRFKEKTHLTKHMVVHTGRDPQERRFGCNECKKAFFNKPNLIKHLRTHIKEKPFQCTECNKCFQNKYNLGIHMKYHNKLMMKFACNICDKRFDRSSQLVKHMKCHNEINTKEKQAKGNQCSVCYEYCKHKKNLSIHMRLLHPGQRLYACNECDKQYDVKSRLIRHMDSHKGKQYTCDYCNAKFIHRYSLIVHIKIHTKELYVCPVCKRKYSLKCTLKRHMKTKHNMI